MCVMSYRQVMDNCIKDRKNTLHKDPLCGLIPVAPFTNMV